MKWDYWKWFFLGLNAQPGIFKFWDIFLPIHLLISIILAILSPIHIIDASTKFILPLAGIFIGLSFAWAGNAQAIMQESQIENLISKHPDGLKNYVYTFQTAILSVLTTLVFWGIGALGLFDCYLDSNSIWYLFSEIILFFLASISLRECWHVVIGGQLLILTKQKIKQNEK